MSAFDDIPLSWRGRDYTIPANRVMGAIARVEEHVTFAELVAYAQRETMPIVKLAQAYASVLRYAGAQVTDEEMYEGMFSSVNPEDIMAAIMTLLAMFVPKSARPDPSENAEAAEGAPGKKRPAGAPSSRRRTRRRSAKRKS